MKKNDTKGNKGEWGEFYALVKLLSDGAIDVSDRDGITEIENKLLHSVLKDETLFTLLNESEIVCVKDSVSKTIDKNSIYLADKTLKLCECIKNKGCDEQGKRGSFALPFAEDLAKTFDVTTQKAKSLNKADLTIKGTSKNTF